MSSTPRSAINNHFYDDLAERWYAAQDDPVALLRAESRLRNPWVLEQIRKVFGARACAVLDVGCGGGFLSNALGAAGHAVTGIDLSDESMAVARAHDAGGTVRYEQMDAHALAFPDASFDVVCAMDFLEHTDRPGAAVAEAARVLKPGGLFFFHTFSRNWLCYLIVIKGVEWFVPNTPAHMHVLHLFIQPRELRAELERCGLALCTWHGVQPRVWTRAFWRMLATGRVGEDFSFAFTRAKWMGYSGIAQKSR
jgi:2-polyprenyl-6-hydroxyphenyl methylase/3-demethylubiquinone-9 3-methyltransferase